MTTRAPADRLTLVSWRALAFVLAGATLALWPALISGGHPFTMVDTFVYLDQGDAIWGQAAEILRGLLPAAPDAGGGAGGGMSAAAPAAETVGSIRSLPYAAGVGAVAQLGPLAVVWAQACLVMVAVLAVVMAHAGALDGRARIALALAILGGSTLPFVASFAMPDILGGVIVLFAVLLVRGIDRFDTASQIALVAVALFAVSAHYGNIPMAVAVLGAALIARASLGGRVWRAVILAGTACILAAGANVVLGKIAFDETSLTPRRFPILLARSIEDGPARWHLQKACATRSYAVCDWWGDTIPDNVGSALWGERGLENAPPDMQARFRDEEIAILWAAFRSYPVAQAGSLAGNAVHQAFRVGVEYAQIETVHFAETGRRYGVEAAFQPLKPWRDAIGVFQKGVYYAAIAALLWLFATARPGSATRPVVAVILTALAVNAAIFGGLSAPNDRYQARIAWVAVLGAGLLLAERRRAARARARRAVAPARESAA